MKKSKICIVGGGTAGWMTAAYLYKRYSHVANIEIIYNHKEPAIGVGESTTPAIIAFLNEIGISFYDLICNIGSTVKLGIKFENWNADESYYYHPFSAFNYDSNVKDGNILSAFEIANNINNIAECYPNELLDNGLLPFNEQLKYCGSIALHIDAYKFSAFLKQRFENNINVIDGIVKNIKINDNGIESIEVNGKTIRADLFVDCSGLSRTLISTINKDFVRPRKFPLMDKAIPIQASSSNSKDQVFTLAKAHNYGWMWKIPLQDRYGIGYVFNSNFLTDNQAYNNFEQILAKDNFKIDNLRVINFDPGYYEQPWTKNVVAVGLASGFIEPLESTAIHMICNQLRMFCRHYTFIDSVFSTNAYNNKMKKMYKQTFEFVELHYYGSRNSSEFWQAVKEKNNRTVNLQDFIEKASHSFITASDVYLDHDRIQGSLIFGLQGYTRILQGLNILNSKSASHFLQINNLSNSASQVYQDLLFKRQELLKSSRKAVTVFADIKNEEKLYA